MSMGVDMMSSFGRLVGGMATLGEFGYLFHKGTYMLIELSSIYHL